MQDLIYNQRTIPRDQYRYGFRSSAEVGCGWIATHNALTLMGYRTDTHRLIRYFERQLPLIHGNTGTSFWGPAQCLKKMGFPVKLTARLKSYDAAAKEADVCILFYHWRKKLKFGAHFVALHHTPDGFVGYNTFRNSTGPDAYGESLQAFIRKRNYFGTVLITVHNPRKAK